MNTMKKAAAALGATAAIAASAALATGQDAVAQATRQTLSFTTHQLQDRIVHGVDVATDKDLQHGVVTGYDVTSCVINVHTRVASCDVAVARAGGMLFGHANINVQTGHGTGRIFGGTRTFHGATGTITVDMPHVTLVFTS